MRPGNEAEWAERVRQAEASGLSIPAFAAKHQVSKSALYHWRNRFAAEAAEAQAPPPPSPSSSTALAFVRLEPVAQQSSAEPIEVLLHNGRIVRVPLAFDEAVLSRVIDIAERGAR
ncbi:MAG: IS66 family insertion sequence element accessory protein TnpA [Ilumatobacteraceae bacterium]